MAKYDDTIGSYSERLKNKYKMIPPEKPRGGRLRQENKVFPKQPSESKHKPTIPPQSAETVNSGKNGGRTGGIWMLVILVILYILWLQSL